LQKPKIEHNFAPEFGMFMRTWVQKWVGTSLVLAVALLLLHGRTVGYRCDCGEVAKLVPMPDCHPLEHHAKHQHADGCDLDEDHDSDGADHSHKHPAVQEQPEWCCRDAGWSGLPALAGIPMPVPAEFVLSVAEVPRALPVINFSPPPPRLTFLTSLLLI
jgi:hypothetical protein